MRSWKKKVSESQHEGDMAWAFQTAQQCLRGTALIR